MLYLSLFCLNLSYKSLDVYNSGGGVVPNSDVYKYSDPSSPLGLRKAPLFFQFTTLEYLVVVGAICANRVDHSYLTPNLHNTEPEWRQRALGEGIVQHGPSRVEHQFPNQSHCKKRRPFGVLPTRDVSAAKCSRRMLLPRRRFFAPSIFDVPLFDGLAMSCAIGTSFPESRWRVQCSKSGLFSTR